MNAVSGGILLLLLVIVSLAPRRWAVLGLLAGVFFLTQGHYVSIVGVEFTPIRILQVAAFARVAVRGELDWSRLTQLDRTVLLLYVYTAVVWLIGPTGFSARPFSLALDGTLCYLAFRGLISTIDDVRELLYDFVTLLVPYTGLVVIERQTAGLPFAVVGGNWEMYFRNGIPRCQGSFRHAINLGTVAATFVPMYIGLWLQGVRRTAATVGCCLCLALVVLSNSGIPLTSAATAAVGWTAWVVRRQMAAVRVATVAMLVVLSVGMKDAIWYLPFKVSQIVGGTGYHRSVLMEKSWQNLSHWWLAGMRIEDTAGWFPYAEMFYGGVDVTNQYLIFAFRAGIPALFLLLRVLILSFRGLGVQLASTRRSPELSKSEPLLWGLGVALFVHAIAFTSMAYFDQSYAVWLMHVAMIAAASQPLAAPAAGRVGGTRRSVRSTGRRLAVRAV